MTVAELIEKLREYPIDSELDCRMVAGAALMPTDGKIILVVEGHELDPVCQIKGPFQSGYGKRESSGEFACVAQRSSASGS